MTNITGEHENNLQIKAVVFEVPQLFSQGGRATDVNELGIHENKYIILLFLYITC